MRSPASGAQSSFAAGSTALPSEDSLAGAAAGKPVEDGTGTGSGPGVRAADCAFGWIPTLAVGVNYMFIFGASNSYGVFSTYYLTQKFVGTPAATLSWIGSLITTFMLG
ncbi:hypothetical protein IWQ56_004201, partial [Coemansia nantahalensis]